MIAATPAAIPKPRILVVEDEGIVAWDIENNLRDLGFEVVGVASCSGDALTFAEREQPDLVLMDIRIQGELDGIGTAELLRERFGMPIVYLTAHGDPETLDRAKNTEPLGYLIKPFKKTELNSVVRIALFRHGMERKLRERERWLSTTLRSIGEAVITTNTEGNVTFINRTGEALTGWRHEETTGLPLDRVLKLRDERTGEPVELPVGKAMRERVPVSIPAAILIQKQGSERAITDSVAPVVDDDEVYGAVLVLRDMTDERLMQKQLEWADQLASLGTMAAGVAHEINNPLAFVIANLDFAITKLGQAEPDRGSRPGPAAVVDALVDAKQGAERVAKIVGDLRRFARQDQPKLFAIDIRPVLGWAIDVTMHEWRHRARVERRFEQVPLVEGDETRLGQVFVNLLVNAAQAITPGAVEKNMIAVTCATDGEGRAVVEIHDTGSGMTPDVRKRLFSPFFTTKPVGRGMGLGLSICYGIVKSLGGTIEVETEPGRGSVFRLLLPPARPRELAVSAASLQKVDAPAPRARVLVVDDEPAVGRAIRRTLEPRHDVAHVESAREALDRLNRGEQFDVILCDLIMPDMTGMDLYEALRSRDPEHARRLVFITGGALTARVADFMTSVQNRRLEKPFEPDALRALVAELAAGPNPSRSA